MTIAAAIGLHNFAEGLAIGVSASTGEIGLATVLIIGFALHNATEGFGIVGPLGNVRPSWSWLALAGLVGGGPTFLGLDGRLQRHLRAARARLLRGLGRGDPLRDRRGLERDAPLRAPRARPLAALASASWRASSPTSSSSTAAAEPPPAQQARPAGNTGQRYTERSKIGSGCRSIPKPCNPATRHQSPHPPRPPSSGRRSDGSPRGSGPRSPSSAPRDDRAAALPRDGRLGDPLGGRLSDGDRSRDDHAALGAGAQGARQPAAGPDGGLHHGARLRLGRGREPALDARHLRGRARRLLPARAHERRPDGHDRGAPDGRPRPDRQGQRRASTRSACPSCSRSCWCSAGWS